MITDLGAPLGGGQSARFSTVSYLPSLAAATFVLLLVWAGAPGPLRWPAAWRTVSGLGAGELVALALALTLSAVVTMPLQLSMVRLLEGYWPEYLGAVTALLRRFQLLRRDRLARRAELTGPDEPTRARVVAAGVAGAELRRRYPPADLVRATGLGNALAAAEHRAGAGYGWDGVVAWPRLYPLLTDQVRVIVDARRDMLDTCARLTVTGAVTAVVSVVLLWHSGWWLLLALVPLAVGQLAYLGAIRTATAYGESLVVAFDLCRFELFKAAHLPLPDDLGAEKDLAAALSLQWRQGVPLNRTYHHDSG